ncbi:tRNA (adenosine(37)-N6)-dimethylallyltransferase MiaA [Ectobacillus antri]|uniref:tRNA (adenosine(37)-N6)-dimethylallyltransferase MiaA n=1 Tax=Ectobacillus antri TaxID=2486280 RepID=UPI000F59B64D|nr:tRNA (adenosine(37)-N6)-dimethylallyltransferase MiaA [Ectobacillus antri]
MSAAAKQKVIVIVGPTAVGKTKLSIELAKMFNGEIISGDSMQVYKGMDIGTAKVTKEEQEGIPHYMLDIKKPQESFSVAEFQTRVREHIADIAGRGKLPIIVGGTGLYIQAALYDYQFTKNRGDQEYREKMEAFVASEGGDALFERLKQVDPESASRIHPNNIRRVIRALEIFETTGRTMSESLEAQAHELLYDALFIGLTMEREKLYKRIDMRVDMMMKQGLLEEVSHLYETGIRDCQSIQAIGYKELYAYLENRISLKEAVNVLKTNSRRYAKRQLTWFRNKEHVMWFDVTEGPKIQEISHKVEGLLKL